MIIRFIFFLIVFVCNSLFAKSVIVGDLQGQLGNQLFIIAATVSLALDNDAVPIFPGLLNNPHFNIPINYEKVFSNLNVIIPNDINIEHVYKEPYFNYSPIPYYPNMMISGYFQSEKYFAHHKREIIDLFAPSDSIIEHIKKHYAHILDHPNTVSVHLRSYYREDPAGHIHITYGSQYIFNAIKLFPRDALFVVFTNDMPWCKRELTGIDRNTIFIEGEPHYHDFYLMSMCKHNIISNSSFSWWAAYLNTNPNKIIVAPRIWFNPKAIASTKDLKPRSWMEVSE